MASDADRRAGAALGPRRPERNYDLKFDLDVPKFTTPAAAAELCLFGDLPKIYRAISQAELDRCLLRRTDMGLRAPDLVDLPTPGHQLSAPPHHACPRRSLCLFRCFAAQVDRSASCGPVGPRLGIRLLPAVGRASAAPGLLDRVPGRAQLSITLVAGARSRALPPRAGSERFDDLADVAANMVAGSSCLQPDGGPDFSALRSSCAAEVCAPLSPSPAGIVYRRFRQHA